MATWYIDYKNGNDTTGNGSSGNPYKTLTKALTVAGNGDTIYARGSDAADEIYYEYELSTALTSLTIAADSGHSPTWTQSTARTSWSLTSGKSYTYETAYTPAACYAAWSGATKLTSKASVNEVEATEDSFYADLAGDKLYVHVAGGGSPGTIHTVAGTAAFLSTVGSGMTYRGLRAQWCFAGFKLDNPGTVDTCTVRYHVGDVSGQRSCIAISCTSGTVTVTGCTVDGVYAGSIGVKKTGACDLTVEGCTLSNCAYGVLNDSVGGSLTVDGCTFTGMGDCISVASSSAAVTATVRDCVFTEWAHGVVQLTGAGVTGTVYRNRAWCSSSPTIQPVNGYICEVSAKGYFYHNVVSGMKYSSSSNAYGFYILGSGVTCVVKNNIAHECKTGFTVDYDPTLTSDYNDAYGCTNANYDASWPKGAHDLTVDPQFVAAGTGDFDLQPSSPLIDAAVVVAGINDGYLGAAPDIGWYEYPPPAAAGGLMRRLRR